MGNPHDIGRHAPGSTQYGTDTESSKQSCTSGYFCVCTQDETAQSVAGSFPNTPDLFHFFSCVWHTVDDVDGTVSYPVEAVTVEDTRSRFHFMDSHSPRELDHAAEFSRCP